MNYIINKHSSTKFDSSFENFINYVYIKSRSDGKTKKYLYWLKESRLDSNIFIASANQENIFLKNKLFFS